MINCYIITVVGNQLKLIKVPAVKSTQANEIGKNIFQPNLINDHNDISDMPLVPKQIRKQKLKTLTRTKSVPELNSKVVHL